MTRAAKITYFAALLLGLSIGGYFGSQRTAFALDSYYTVRDEAAPRELDHFSYLQYSYADSEHAKAGLQMAANVLEKIQQLDPDRSHEQELALTYTRLALLEDAEDNSQQSQALMTKARYWLAASNGRDYSESEMKDILSAWDSSIRE
jgi:hypothetical protein